MGKKLKEYIHNYQLLLENKDLQNIDQLKKELLVEIEFWQHERLIHLLVTVLFALLTMMIVVSLFFYKSIGVLVLLAMLLVLLVPYIRHYYILENGVQTLYVFYEELTRREGKIPDSLVPTRNGVYIKPLKKTKDQ